jgi:membrane protein DedA with SNARE-associated domain
MQFVENLINTIQQMSPLGVLSLLFLVAYIENVFPPSPSDVLTVFAGTLVGAGTIGFVPALAASTLGGTLGFMTAYAAGRYFEQRVVQGKFGKYLPAATIHSVEQLFRKYGNGVIVANRFLAGTRAAVSFFAGMSRMNLAVTTALCAVSAAVWNSILLYMGIIFANNWQEAVVYIQRYALIATIVMAITLLVLGWMFFRRRKQQTQPIRTSELDKDGTN